MLRFVVAASAVAFSALPAAAGGYGGCGGDCYRQEYVPPSYGTVTERYVARAPRTYAVTTPARYATTYERVLVSPGGRTWSVSYDAWGRKVGCWITTPPRYATVPRTVMVEAARVVPYAEPAVYGYRSHTVQTSPGYRAWVPLGGGSGGLLGGGLLGGGFLGGRGAGYGPGVGVGVGPVGVGAGLGGVGVGLGY